MVGGGTPISTEENEVLLAKSAVLSKVAKRNKGSATILFGDKNATFKGLPQEHIFVALLQYMELNDERKTIVRMGYSGKNPECVAWSSKPRFLMLVKPWQEGADNPSILTRSMHAKMLRKQTLNGMRRIGHQASAEEMAEEQLQLQQLAESLGLNTNSKSADEGDLGYDLFKACVTNLFKLYAKKAVLDHEDENSFPREEKALILGVKGWIRMCHRMQIFDNDFGYVEAFKLYREVCEDPNSVGFGRAREIELQDFKSLMGKLGKVLFPSDSQEGARESRSKLTARVLIPYLTKEDARRFKHLITGYSLPHPVESLITWETMTIFEQVDEQLKTVYAHYATMEELNMSAMTWQSVKAKGSLINSDNFILFLLNFSVAPVLATKNAALDMLDSARAEAIELGMRFELNYPSFVECIGRVTLLIESTMRQRLLSPDLTVPEFRAMKQLLALTPQRVRLSCKDQLEARGRWFEVEGLHKFPPSKSAQSWDGERLKGVMKAQELTDKLEEKRARACLHGRDASLRRLENQKLKRTTLEYRVWGMDAAAEGLQSWQQASGAHTLHLSSPSPLEPWGASIRTQASMMEPLERLPQLSTSYSVHSVGGGLAASKSMGTTAAGAGGPASSPPRPYLTMRAPVPSRAAEDDVAELADFETRLPTLSQTFTREREMKSWKAETMRTFRRSMQPGPAGLGTGTFQFPTAGAAPMSGAEAEAQAAEHPDLYAFESDAVIPEEDGEGPGGGGVGEPYVTDAMYDEPSPAAGPFVRLSASGGAAVIVGGRESSFGGSALGSPGPTPRGSALGVET